MEYKKLGDICDIVSGGTPSRSKAEYWDGDIPWIKIGNIKGKYVSEADEFITEEGLAGSSAKMLSKGTILYTIFATLGETGVLTIDACTNQAIAGLTIKNENIIYRDYLYYYLKSKKNYVNDIGRGVAQNNINMSILRGFEVPIREMFEQKTITDILDKTEKIINLRTEELNRLDELIKARFVELFGDSENNTRNWPVFKLSELCDVGSSKRIYQEEQTDDGVPFWRISDLVNKMDTGCANSGLYISHEKYNELIDNNQVPVEGDILVTSRGTLGRCYIISDADEFYFQDGMISWLRKYKKGITPLYIKHLFMTPGLIRQIEGMQAGSTVAYLSIAMLKKLDIMLPDSETQIQFEAFVKQTVKSKVAVQKALVETQMLFDSLVHEYFG